MTLTTILYIFQYGVALLVALLLEITAIVLAISFRETAENYTKSFLKSSIHNYYAPPNETDGVTLFWNHMMVQVNIKQFYFT